MLHFQVFKSLVIVFEFKCSHHFVNCQMIVLPPVAVLYSSLFVVFTTIYNRSIHQKELSNFQVFNSTLTKIPAYKSFSALAHR